MNRDSRPRLHWYFLGVIAVFSCQSKAFTEDDIDFVYGRPRNLMFLVMLVYLLSASVITACAINVGVYYLKKYFNFDHSQDPFTIRGQWVLIFELLIGFTGGLSYMITWFKYSAFHRCICPNMDNCEEAYPWVIKLMRDLIRLSPENLYWRKFSTSLPSFALCIGTLMMALLLWWNSDFGDPSDPSPGISHIDYNDKGPKPASKNTPSPGNPPEPCPKTPPPPPSPRKFPPCPHCGKEHAPDSEIDSKICKFSLKQFSVDKLMQVKGFFQNRNDPPILENPSSNANQDLESILVDSSISAIPSTQNPQSANVNSKRQNGEGADYNRTVFNKKFGKSGSTNSTPIVRVTRSRNSKLNKSCATAETGTLRRSLRINSPAETLISQDEIDRTIDRLLDGTENEEEQQRIRNNDDSPPPPLPQSIDQQNKNENESQIPSWPCIKIEDNDNDNNHDFDMDNPKENETSGEQLQNPNESLIPVENPKSVFPFGPTTSYIKSKSKALENSTGQNPVAKNIPKKAIPNTPTRSSKRIQNNKEQQGRQLRAIENEENEQVTSSNSDDDDTDDLPALKNNKPSKNPKGRGNGNGRGGKGNGRGGRGNGRGRKRK